MVDPNVLSREALQEMQARGASLYLDAYVRLMARALGVDAVNAEVLGMMVMMIDPLNHATEAIWRAMMKDGVGALGALDRFKESLDEFSKKDTP